MRKGLSSGSYKPLTEEGILKIHETVIRIIEEIGFQVNSETAMDLFSKAGARVDRQNRIVNIPRELVMSLIKSAPSEILLAGREEKYDIYLGSNRVYAGTGGTALYIYEPKTNIKRLAQLKDIKNIGKLVDKLENIHLYMLPTYPNELQVTDVDVNRFFSGLDNTSKHIMGGVYTEEGVTNVVHMAEIIAGSPENLRKRPLISMVACSISPFKLDGRYGDLVINIARHGIPLIVPAEPLCGATSPVTLAANVTIQTVDSLMGVMLSQIVNPGTPVIFGSVATSTDLKDLKYLAGSIEMGLINSAGAQMAQFYKLPFYGTGGMSDSKVLDAQCGYEAAMTTLLGALAGVNFIHDAAGLMEFAMTACYEKLVIDNEIIGMAMRAVEGIKVDDETLAFDLMKKIGPAGNFITAKHTRHYMRREHYQPALSDRRLREDWYSSGQKETWQRASDSVEDLLKAEHYSLPLDVRNRIISEIKGIKD
jgi:trimethylamine--corrinoid protein Co-methyltransferase